MLERIQLALRSQLLKCSDEAVCAGLAEIGRVAIIVPNHNWEIERKLMLAERGVCGVSVDTYAQWISRLWECYGDGSRLVTKLQRQMLIRPLIQEVGLFDEKPSVKLVSMLGEFAADALDTGLQPQEELSDYEGNLMELVAIYGRQLELSGLVEQVQIERRLATCDLPDFTLVVEEPGTQSVHRETFFLQLAKERTVTIVEQDPLLVEDVKAQDELTRLRSTLFSGCGGLEATGQVLVGVCGGAHVRAELLVHMLDRIGTTQTAVLFGSVAEASVHVMDALARAGVAFSANFTVALARTGLGGALFELMQACAGRDDKLCYSALVDFVASPYCGICSEAARALQMWWRSHAHSTQDERMADLRNGFSQGNTEAATMKEMLAPLRELIDATDTQRVQLMLSHARDAHLDVDTLFDDCAAADAALDYIEACTLLHCKPNIDDLSNLRVPLARSFGEQTAAVRLLDASSLGLSHFSHVVLCDLDALHYPMARRGDVFDDIRKKLGIACLDDTARRQRVLLKAAIEAAEMSFAFCRTTTDLEGCENRESTLFDELVGAYRSPSDDAAGLPAADLSPALATNAISICEAQVFFDGIVSDTSSQISRGKLVRPLSFDLLISNPDGRSERFSPTGLEDYYRCPYRWFATRRVGFSSMDARFDPAAQGTLVHDTLKRFYHMLHEQGQMRVLSETLEEARNLASRAFDIQLELALADARSGVFVRTETDRLICEELRSQVIGIIERDAGFLPGFSPRYFELMLGQHKEQSFEYAGVPVRGKVDRIDIDDMGRAVVIDYKLSSLSSGYGLPADRKRFGGFGLRIQTDIYATLVERYFQRMGEPVEVVGSVYRSYAKNMLRGVYAAGIDWGRIEKTRVDLDAMVGADGGVSAYHDYLARVEKMMSCRMECLYAGDIEPRPLAYGQGICTYCKASGFCPREENS